MHYPEISWMIVARATLLLTIVAIACQLLRRQSAALRHALWASCLTALPSLLAADLLPALWQPTLFRSANPAVQPSSHSEFLPDDRRSWFAPNQQFGQSASLQSRTSRCQQAMKLSQIHSPFLHLQITQPLNHLSSKRFQTSTCPKGCA